MGSWNKTCVLSNYHITSGQKVAIFLLTEQYRGLDHFCYSNSYFSPCLFPFYGEYDDYGKAENLSGISIPFLENSIKENLVEFEVGPNECHDLEVKKEKFNIDIMFDLEHEGRLRIRNPIEDYFLKSMANDSRDIKPESLMINKHRSELYSKFGGCIFIAMIHGDIYKDIINNYKWDTYYWDKPIKFKDVEEAIPYFVKSIKEEVKKDSYKHEFYDCVMRFYGKKDLPSQIISRFFDFNPMEESIINRRDLIVNSLDLSDEELGKILIEMAKGKWIDNFMYNCRKTWIKTTGEGSQESDHNPYLFLNNSISKIVNKEKKMW
jgi:hypothetical protein